MKVIRQFLCLLAMVVPGIALAQEPSMDIPKNMAQYMVALIVPGPKWSTDDTPETKQVLRQHLAFIKSMTAAKKYVFAGPMTDGGRFLGIVIVRAASVDEARKFLSADPEVQAGRFAVEIHPAMFPDLKGVEVVY
jgi:uncharacterized protein YciI